MWGGQIGHQFFKVEDEDEYGTRMPRQAISVNLISIKQIDGDQDLHQIRSWRISMVHRVVLDMRSPALPHEIPLPVPSAN